MSTKSLNAYFNAFKNEYRLVVGNLKPYHAFTVFCAKYYYFFDSPVDIEKSFLDNMPDGANDGGIDAIFANPSDTSELVVIQGKYYKKANLAVQTFKNDLNKIIDTVKGLKNHRIGSLNEKVQAAFFAADNELDDGYSIRIDFCTFSRPTKAVVQRLQKVCADKSSETKFHIRFISHDDILRQVVACETSADTVPEYTLSIDKPDNKLRYDDSIVVNISAQSLQKLYKLHGNRVLGRNLRYHIKSGSQAKQVDDKIKETITNEPENFWYLNNGILIACDKYELPRGSKDLKIFNFSIVNGGQTTYKVANTPDLSTDFFIQCKVVVAKGTNEEERSKFCLKIANATNAQKPIKPADLKANEPEQLLLKRNLAGLGFYYVTKAGDRPQKNTFKNYQICNLDKVGKAALAGILMMPGSARSGASKMFEEPYYEAIFEKSIPNAITDLLTLINHYKTFQRKVIANPDAFGFVDDDCLPTVKNGEKFYLACIGFLAKIKAKAFTFKEFKNAKAKGDEEVQALLLRNGGLTRIITASGDTYEPAQKVFDILTKRVIAECCKIHRMASGMNGETFVHTNYLKKDSSFINDVITQLWKEYSDEYSPLKSAVDALIGLD